MKVTPRTFICKPAKMDGSVSFCCQEKEIYKNNIADMLERIEWILLLY
jgi:hypothetical protein